MNKVSPVIRQSLDEFYKGDVSAFLEKYSYIEEVISRVPKYSAVDTTTAAEIANMALAASMVCAELIHDISRQSGILETLVKAEEADAYYRSQQKTAAMKKVDSQKDEEFIKIQNKASSAKCFLDFLRREYQLLVGQHYYCKELIKGLHSIHSAEGSSPMDIDDLL